MVILIYRNRVLGCQMLRARNRVRNRVME